MNALGIKFLLTRPLRDVTAVFLMNALGIKFLLTRPLRDVTTKIWVSKTMSSISTHTPLTGRDIILAG